MSCSKELKTDVPSGRREGYVLNPEGADSKFLAGLTALAKRLVTGTSKRDQLLSNNILDKSGGIRVGHPAVQEALYDMFAEPVEKILKRMIADAEEEREKDKKSCKSCD